MPYSNDNKNMKCALETVTKNWRLRSELHIPYHTGTNMQFHYNMGRRITGYKIWLHKSTHSESEHTCFRDSHFTSLGVSTIGCSAAFTAGTPVWTMGTTRSPDGGGSVCNKISSTYQGITYSSLHAALPYYKGAQIWEPPQNCGCQKGNMKQVPY